MGKTWKDTPGFRFFEYDQFIFINLFTFIFIFVMISYNFYWLFSKPLDFWMKIAFSILLNGPILIILIAFLIKRIYLKGCMVDDFGIMIHGKEFFSYKDISRIEKIDNPKDSRNYAVVLKDDFTGKILDNLICIRDEEGFRTAVKEHGFKIE